MFYLLNSLTGLLADVITLAVYLIGAYAIFKVAKIRFLPNAWLAFIPFFNLYMSGMIIDSMKYNHYKINRYISDIPMSYALPLLSLASNVVYVLPLIGGLAGSIIGILLWASEILMYYFLFHLYAEPKQCIPFTLLSLIPLVGPILILYVLKDRRY